MPPPVKRATIARSPRDRRGKEARSGRSRFPGNSALSSIWQTTRRFVYKRVLHADDTPHRIALGVAIATFVAFTPTMGLQTVIALALAAVLRANKAVCVPLVWITNPATFVPIYWSCWRIGAAVVPNAAATEDVAVMHRLAAYAHPAHLGRVLTYDFWSQLFYLMVDLGTELWVGCIIVGLILGICGYFATRWTVTAYRTRRAQRRARIEERRRLRSQARAAAKRRTRLQHPA